MLLCKDIEKARSCPGGSGIRPARGIHMRASGVLMPIFSLPGKYGIGCFGKEAYNFADSLKAAGQTYWQILPLGPTGYGDSPYQSFSTFAGNPYYIDIESFPETVLPKKIRNSFDFGKDSSKVDYGRLYEGRLELLYHAYQVENYCGLEKEYPEFEPFCRENDFWLSDYALFMSIKEDKGGLPWYEWEKGLRDHDEKALEPLRSRLGDRIRFHKWLQFRFHSQWKALKGYANKLGIRFIGDLPIYVSYDSSDVWASPELFAMDGERRPRWVAGVPPDAFSATGQLWGNPVYDWGYHEHTGFAWWIKRIEKSFELVDMLRLDHFRGFDEYYCVPFGDPTAEGGHWEKGPGMKLFDAVKRKLGDKAIIAEDLGILTDSVRELLKESGYPGMKVLEFAFDPDGKSDYLPHHWIRNCVGYTGTHDNQTLSAWYGELSRAELRFMTDYMDLDPKDRSGWNDRMIRSVLGSTADTAIIPMGDWLGLGKEARINAPSTFGGNWTWRMDKKAFDRKLIKRMRHFSELYGRI